MTITVKNKATPSDDSGNFLIWLRNKIYSVEVIRIGIIAGRIIYIFLGADFVKIN